MSELRADTITASNGTGPVTLTKQSAAKAFVFYDQANNINRGSFGVSSITDSATGNFDIAVTNAFDDAYYAMTGTSGYVRVVFTNREDSNGLDTPNITTKGYGSTNFGTGTLLDMHSNCVVFHGDLA
jgi:hypothetical protein